MCACAVHVSGLSVFVRSVCLSGSVCPCLCCALHTCSSVTCLPVCCLYTHTRGSVGRRVAAGLALDRQGWQAAHEPQLLGLRHRLAMVKVQAVRVVLVGWWCLWAGGAGGADGAGGDSDWAACYEGACCVCANRCKLTSGRPCWRCTVTGRATPAELDSVRLVAVECLGPAHLLSKRTPSWATPCQWMHSDWNAMSHARPRELWGHHHRRHTTTTTITMTTERMLRIQAVPRDINNVGRTPEDFLTVRFDAA